MPTKPTRSGSTRTVASSSRGRATAPAPHKKSKSTINSRTRLILIIAAIVVVAVVAVVVITQMQNAEPETHADAFYVEGVSVAGIDLAGKSLEEATALVKPVADNMLASAATQTVSFKAGETGAIVALTGAELGVTTNYEEVLKQAIEYGNMGENRATEKENAKKSGMSFPIALIPDDAKLAAALTAHEAEFDVPAKSATAKVVKQSDKANLTTSASFEYENEQVGVIVDRDALTASIKQELADGDMTGVITATVTTVQPKWTVAEFKEKLDCLGQYTSYYEKSSLSGSGRRFNIWKMSDVINGVEIKPGETWSINEEAGPRTSETGWADAGGIRNGITVQEPGGGICQVSSTLYNAVLLADVPYENISRKHHSWPSDYMPVGQDATISTGSPDFKLTNSRDTSLWIIAVNDGPSRKLTVKVYGMPLEHGLTVKIRNDIKKTIEAPTEELREYNAELSPGQEVVARSAKKGYVVDVYRQYFKADGTLDHEVKLYTDSYNAYAKKIQYGPEGTPTPAPTTAAPSKTPGPSSDPEKTPKPSTNPTKEPEPDPTTEPDPMLE